MVPACRRCIRRACEGQGWIKRPPWPAGVSTQLSASIAELPVRRRAVFILHRLRGGGKSRRCVSRRASRPSMIMRCAPPRFGRRTACWRWPGGVVNSSSTMRRCPMSSRRCVATSQARSSSPASDLARRRVSGTMAIADTDAALEFLEQAHGLRTSRVGPLILIRN